MNIPITSNTEAYIRSVSESREKEKTRFRLGVYLSRAVLFAFLAFIFSGTNFAIGSIKFNTIQLDFVFILDNFPFIAEGIYITLWLSVLSIILAMLMAIFGALGELSAFPPIYALATFYISLFRGTPLLLQLLFFFLALPQLGLQLTGPVAGVLTLGLNYGAYIAEIMRAGIESVSRGQREAAMAIGMTRSQIMRRIVFPQALRLVVPPLGNQFISMQKDTALVSVTGFVWEILWRAQKVGRANFRSLESLLVAAVIYWMMTIILESLQRRIEIHLTRGEYTS